MIYKGYVSRQELIDFCREEASTALASSKRNEEASDTPGLDKDSAAVLEATAAADRAMVLAYRKICDWAANHNRPLMVEPVVNEGC